MRNPGPYCDVIFGSNGSTIFRMDLSNNEQHQNQKIIIIVRTFHLYYSTLFPLSWSKTIMKYQSVACCSLGQLSIMSSLLFFPFRGTVSAFSGRWQHNIASNSLCRLARAARQPAGVRWYSNISNNGGNGDSLDENSNPNHDLQGGEGPAALFAPHDHSLSNGRLKHRLRCGLPLTGVVTGQYRDTDHVEMLGLLGYDFLWADCEHSSGSPDHVLNLILAAERRGIPTLVRIGYGYQNIIG
jgi:hypothetical protein